MSLIHQFLESLDRAVFLEMSDPLFGAMLSVGGLGPPFANAKNSQQNL